MNWPAFFAFCSRKVCFWAFRCFVNLLVIAARGLLICSTFSPAAFTTPRLSFIFLYSFKRWGDVNKAVFIWTVEFLSQLLHHWALMLICRHTQPEEAGRISPDPRIPVHYELHSYITLLIYLQQAILRRRALREPFTDTVHLQQPCLMSRFQKYEWTQRLSRKWSDNMHEQEL